MDGRLKRILKKEKLEDLLWCFRKHHKVDSSLGRLTADSLREIGIVNPGVQKRLLAAFKTTAISSDPAFCDLVEVYGGTLPEDSGLNGTKVENFMIGRFPVTVKEWERVQKWGDGNGEIFISERKLGSQLHPVRQVNWIKCLEWCNLKSLMDGLEPAYEMGVKLKPKANGYRLPTEAEWEWAARGGYHSRHFIFAGSNDLDDVGWYSKNSGGVAHPRLVGQKAANEIGIYDMSGNVYEWCEDEINTPSYRSPNWFQRISEAGRKQHLSWVELKRKFIRARGGCWKHDAGSCALSARPAFCPDRCWDEIGFRLARNLED
jgi:sulfatase modifying factor 1